MSITEKEIAEFRAMLDTRRREIEEQLASGSEAVRPVDLGEPIGRLSRMDAMQQQEMAQASRRALQVTRERVLAALRAIESGDFGLCRSCEEEMSLQRLRAQPEAPLCIRCQTGVEKS